MCSSSGQVSDPLSDDESVFEQQTADLIDRRRTLSHRLAADPVDVLQVLLLDRLHPRSTAGPR